MGARQRFREQGSGKSHYRVNEFHQLQWKSATLPFAYQKFGVKRVRQTIDSEEYPYRPLELTGNTKVEDLVGYDRFLTASGAYKHHKIPMMRPGDWGQGKNCTLFMFNNVPGDADDPEYRNPRLTGNVRYEIDFRAAVGHKITVVIWSEYENIYEIDQWDEFFTLSTAEMEFVALSDTVLNHLATKDPELNKAFRGVFPAEKLPTVFKIRGS